MKVETVRSLDDPRLDAFRDVQRRRPASPFFIAEGPLLVERLLQSPLEVVSILTTPGHVARLSDKPVAWDCLLQMEPSALRELVGFRFHRGMLACGRRPKNPGIDMLLGDGGSDPPTVLVCPLLRDEANLGGLLRVGSAFGVSGLLLGPHCPDPFSRKTLRASMGAAFTLPIRRSSQPLDDLDWLHEKAGFTSLATVLDAAAQPVRQCVAPDRLAVVAGSEDRGLDEIWQQRCQQRITIPMRPGTDSLNVAVAMAIVLHELRG